MDCSTVLDFFDDYSEKHLSESQVIEITSHLEKCSSCHLKYIYLSGFFARIESEKQFIPDPFWPTRFLSVREKFSSSHARFSSFIIRPVFIATFISLALLLGISLGVFTGKTFYPPVSSQATSDGISTIRDEFSINDIFPDNNIYFTENK